MEENKQAILDALLPALKLTRAGAGITEMRYHKEDDRVNIIYGDGSRDSVNVNMDSGIAMIIDVAKAVMYW